jgi:hypothetical protein
MFAANKLTLETAPIGTKAPAVTGGYWVRVPQGWAWCTGATFPRPGGDWNGDLIPPTEAATITVTIAGNEVVFTDVEGKGIYTNGTVRLSADDTGEWACWVENAFSNGGSSLTPQQALDELREQAEAWKPVLDEYERLAGKAPKHPDPPVEEELLSEVFLEHWQAENEASKSAALSSSQQRLAEHAASIWTQAAEIAQTFEAKRKKGTTT